MAISQQRSGIFSNGQKWRIGDRPEHNNQQKSGHRYLGGYSNVSLGPGRLNQTSTLKHMGFDPGRCDGIFGQQTETALREFQRNVGQLGDGTVGPQTLKALDMLRRTVTGGSPSERREEERLMRGGGYRASASPRGRKLAHLGSSSGARLCWCVS